MANRTASLVRNAKVPGVGWRRGKLVTAKNGRVKPDYMIYDGLEIHCPDGHYDIRFYIGRKMQHKNVGRDLTSARPRSNSLRKSSRQRTC